MRKFVSCLCLLLSGIHLSVSDSSVSINGILSKTNLKNGRHCRSVRSDHKRSFIQTWALIRRGGGNRSDTDEQKEDASVEKDIARKILGGSLLDALQDARSKARLLIVFLPALRSAQTKSSIETFDQIALSSLLSDAVHSAAERSFRKSKKSANVNSNLGSFVSWSSPHGTSNYQTAISLIKKLKGLSPLGNKASPYLLVLYPAQILDAQTGKPKVVPRLLSQHHCNPPPTAESMAAWLLALRKRHKKLYVAMHRDLAELQFLRERIVGYSQSVQENKALDEREKLEEEQRLEMEQKEQQRLQNLQARRKSLLESLPEEPNVHEVGVITIALRFPDGRSGKRRFLQDTKLRTLFDWVDAVFEEEREKIELSTMTGQKMFTLASTDANTTLKDAGLGKMAGLRVTILETGKSDHLVEQNNHTEEDGDNETEEDNIEE